MPRRILLGQDFFHYDYVSNDETVYTEVPFYYTYLTLLINWGDEKLDNLEEGEIKFMRYWLNMWFLRGGFWEPELGTATSGYSANDKKTDIFDEFVLSELGSERSTAKRIQSRRALMGWLYGGKQIKDYIKENGIDSLKEVN